MAGNGGVSLRPSTLKVAGLNHSPGKIKKYKNGIPDSKKLTS